MSIEIANESGTTVDTDSVLGAARYALEQMGVNPLAELSILLVDVEYMTELNHRWMDGDGPTDVLAFPMDEGSVDHGPGEAGCGEPALLGDIVLCPEIAAKQADQAGGRGEQRDLGQHHCFLVARQLSSSRACNPNISRSSSGSAWS